MAIFIENEIDAKFDFDYNEVIESVINEAANYVGCPYEISVEVTIVDNETIRQINKEQRDIDNPTDVLSFPMVEYEIAGDFEFLDKDGSGQITLDELKRVFGVNANKEAEGMLIRIIKDVDMDDNGEISFEEFKRMMINIINV